MKLFFNKSTQMWEEYKIPYGSIDCPTKEDYDALKSILDAHCKCGKTVWVVERYEDGAACDVSGYVFIISVCGVALVSPTLNDCDDPNFILDEQVEQTRGGIGGDLAAYPLSDCYWSREEAVMAFEAEKEDKS